MQHLRSQPLVSAVVASYSLGRYLPLTINTILASTGRRVEVVIEGLQRLFASDMRFIDRYRRNPSSRQWQKLIPPMQHLNTRPLVSVVVASYNMGQYLPLAVNSVLASSYSNIEVIIIDDGSTDDTAQRIQPCLGDPRIQYFRQENQGQTKAKNNGLRAATGEFIAFCDGDDLWEPEKLERQLPYFANPGVGVVYSEVSIIDEAGNRQQKPPAYRRYSGWVTNQLLIKNFVPFGTAVIRRACLERNGLFDEQFRMGIDWDLWLRYSLDWQFAYVPERTYVSREWPGQMSTNYRGRYEFASKILENFEAKFGERLEPAALRKAWADIYICRSEMFAKNERTFVQPLKDVLKGIMLDASNKHGWKTLIMLLFLGL